MLNDNYFKERLNYLRDCTELTPIDILKIKYTELKHAMIERRYSAIERDSFGFNENGVLDLEYYLRWQILENRMRNVWMNSAYYSDFSLREFCEDMMEGEICENGIARL